MLEPMHPGMKCHVFSLKQTLRNPQVWQKERIPPARPFLHSNTHVQKEEYNYKVQMAAQPSCFITNPLWLVYLWLTSFDSQHHGVCCASPNSGSHRNHGVHSASSTPGSHHYRHHGVHCASPNSGSHHNHGVHSASSTPGSHHYHHHRVHCASPS